MERCRYHHYYGTMIPLKKGYDGMYMYKYNSYCLVYRNCVAGEFIQRTTMKQSTVSYLNKVLPCVLKQQHLKQEMNWLSERWCVWLHKILHFV